MAEHLLELRNVSQVYRSGDREFLALKNVSLTLDEGEFLVLLGPSGCGKSTLLRIATGLPRPTSGEVLYRGEPLKGVNPKATIVFQTFALFPWLTVLENVEVALAARGVPPRSGGAEPWKFWTGWVWTDSRAPIPGNSPEGCVKKSALRGPWWWNRSFCASMSRFPRWMFCAPQLCGASFWNYG